MPVITHSDIIYADILAVYSQIQPLLNPSKTSKVHGVSTPLQWTETMKSEMIWATPGD